MHVPSLTILMDLLFVSICINSFSCLQMVQPDDIRPVTVLWHEDNGRRPMENNGGRFQNGSRGRSNESEFR